jgi:histidinol-phosphate aminotransferase
MPHNEVVSRRAFMGGMAATLTYAGSQPTILWSAQNTRERVRPKSVEDYDRMAKLSFNENPDGPSETVLKAMTDAFKYANRYGYPDGGITEAIADHHGVKPENVLLGAGSGEILKVADDTFLVDHKKVIGVDPTFGSVYQFATNSKAEAIKVPLLEDYRMDIPGIIRAVKNNYRDVGFVYICNPNNPTGNIIPKQEVKLLLDSIPGDVPVLIDEAYHHFVEDPNYVTSVPYILERRQVIVTRTFSKIAALAGMRLGYGLAPKELVARMSPFANGSINAIVKWGGVAALKDTATQARTRKNILALRKKVTGELTALGYSVIPSEANFFMVHVRRDITPIIDEFEKKGVLVGRKFPPMVEHLRVSVGTPDEMNRFMAAFREIFGAGKSSTSAILDLGKPQL